MKLQFFKAKRAKKEILKKVKTWKLEDIVEKNLRETLGKIASSYDPKADVFAEHFKKDFGDNLGAVLFYGSRFANCASEHSIYDFFLIVKNVRKLHRCKREEYKSYVFPRAWVFNKLLNSVQMNVFLNKLGPNFYNYEFEDNGKEYRSKYGVMSIKYFIKNISKKDNVHLSGRFSKLTGIVYAKNDKVLEDIVNGFINSAKKATIIARSLMGEVNYSPSEFLRKVVGFSYHSDVRDVDKGKSEIILSARKKDYEDVYLPLINSYKGGKVSNIEEYLRSHMPFYLLTYMVKGLITNKGWGEYAYNKIKKSWSEKELKFVKYDPKKPNAVMPLVKAFFCVYLKHGIVHFYEKFFKQPLNPS